MIRKLLLLTALVLGSAAPAQTPDKAQGPVHVAAGDGSAGLHNGVKVLLNAG